MHCSHYYSRWFLDPLKNCYWFPSVNVDGNPARLRSSILMHLVLGDGLYSWWGWTCLLRMSGRHQRFPSMLLFSLGCLIRTMYCLLISSFQVLRCLSISAWKWGVLLLRITKFFQMMENLHFIMISETNFYGGLSVSFLAEKNRITSFLLISYLGRLGLSHLL
jgi:hypothetical protein